VNPIAAWDRVAVGAALVLLLGACGSPAAPDTGSASPLQAQVVASEFVVGAQQRVPIGVLDHGTPVSDATVHVRGFLLQGSTGVFKGESDAPFKGAGLQGAGAYVARLDFMTAGTWGLDVTASRPNGQRAVIRLSNYADGRPLTVVSTPVVPTIGQPAPMSHNLTIKEADASTIDSGRPPDDMHQISIADAIAQHRPTLIIFASPAFCTSRLCGPEVRVVQGLEPAYRDRLTFIHIEVYRDFVPDPSKRKLATTVTEWRLQTEPWIFLVDPRGTIQARFEGPTATDEVGAAIDRLLA
jgi:hypothetical protein